MKKSSFLLGAAALMLATACSNDEVVKVADNSAAIGFSTFVNKSTRAVDNDNSTLQNLQVWGLSYRGTDGSEIAPYAVFGGDVVTKGTPVWTYDNTRYWVAGNAYTFAAVAPAKAQGVEVTPGTTVAGAVASIGFTNPGNVDLLYNKQDVTAQTNAADYSTVEFNLGHILSRIKFEFKNELAEGYSIKVKKLSINNAKATGTFATATESWTNVSGEKNYDFTTAAEATEAEGTVVSEPSYLFPTEEETQYNATFEIELILEDAVSKTPVTIDTYEHSVTLPGFTFDKGYSYAFKTVVNAENINPEEEQYPINFTAEVEVWGEESEGNFNLKDDQVKE